MPSSLGLRNDFHFQDMALCWYVKPALAFVDGNDDLVCDFDLVAFARRRLRMDTRPIILARYFNS